MRISVHVSKELQAALQRVRELPTEARRQVRQATKTAAGPIWQHEVEGHAQTRIEQLVLARTARVAVTDRGVRLQAARVGRPLSGGLDIKSQWHAVEFGGDRDRQRTVATRSRRGTPYDVKRHTQRQLAPRRSTGYVVFPAVAKAVPRLASLWVQTVMRAGHEALEGR